MIKSVNLSKKFGNITALSGLNLTVDPGEFVFLTGPSGSGKTTLLRLIMREYHPDSGELIVNGEDLKKLKKGKIPMYRRTIGPIFQDFKLLMDRSVFENIALPLDVRHVKSQEIKSAVKLALEMVGLSDRENLFPSQLSGGEIQRVAVARAIVGKPSIILADEPTGNLDPHTSKIILKLLRDIHQELKTTVIMATHNADLVNHNSLRVVKLEGGKLTKDEQKGKYE